MLSWIFSLIFHQTVFNDELYHDLGYEQNVLSEQEMHQIWKPNVGYTNAKLGRLEKESLGIMVRRESEPQPFDFSSSIEGIIFNFCHGTQRLNRINTTKSKHFRNSWALFADKIYLGHENSLVMKTKVYAEYGCVFNLRNFPFDTQNCSMNFTVDSAKATYIQLAPRNITFQVMRCMFCISPREWYESNKIICIW